MAYYSLVFLIVEIIDILEVMVQFFCPSLDKQGYICVYKRFGGFYTNHDLPKIKIKQATTH